MARTQQTCAETQAKHRPLVWDTASVGRGEAFDYYREGICAAFMPLRPELGRDRRKHFRANVASYGLDDGTLNIVSARSHLVCRGHAEIAASPEDCYYLNTQTAGECRIFQNGASVTLRPGDVGIFDSGAGFDLEHESRPVLGVASLVVPKRLLHDLCGTRFDGAPHLLSAHPVFGALIAEAGGALARGAGRVSAADLSRLYRVVISIAAMAADPDATDASSAARSDAQFHRIRRIVRQCCADPDFSIADCAARAGLSTGYIHQLFARHDDRFGAYLLKERLRRAAFGLTDPARAHLPISTIAFEAGFRDLSHFGRTFRREFDATPGDWRRRNTR